MAPNYLQSGRAKIKALKNHTGKISSLEDKKRKKKVAKRLVVTTEVFLSFDYAS